MLQTFLDWFIMNGLNTIHFNFQKLVFLSFRKNAALYLYLQNIYQPSIQTKHARHNVLVIQWYSLALDTQGIVGSWPTEQEFYRVQTDLTHSGQTGSRPWWRHEIETFSALLALVRGIHRSSVNSSHKGQCRGAVWCFYWSGPEQTVE